MRSDDRTPPIDIGDLQRQLAAAMEAHGEVVVRLPGTRIGIRSVISLALSQVSASGKHG